MSHWEVARIASRPHICMRFAQGHTRQTSVRDRKTAVQTQKQKIHDRSELVPGFTSLPSSHLLSAHACNFSRSFIFCCTRWELRLRTRATEGMSNLMISSKRFLMNRNLRPHGNCQPESCKKGRNRTSTSLVARTNQCCGMSAWRCNFPCARPVDLSERDRNINSVVGTLD